MGKMEEEEEEEEESIPGCTLFIKNLNFNTTQETLKEVSLGNRGMGPLGLQPPGSITSAPFTLGVGPHVRGWRYLHTSV